MTETELEAGDRVRHVNMPSERQRAMGRTPTETEGVVTEIVDETKHVGVNDTIEQTLAVIETDGGDEKRVNVKHLNSELDADTGGVTIQIINEDSDGEDGEDSEDSEDSKPEAVTDGGRDVTDHVSDEQIEAAIKSNDDPDHPEAPTVDEVRDVLAAIVESTHEIWGEWMDNIERGDSTVVAETDSLIVLDTGKQNAVGEELKFLADMAGYEFGEESSMHAIVTQLMHEVAGDHSDRRWPATWPFVLRKPDSFDAGQQYVESVVNGLQRRGLSPGQAWAYYGVEIRGESRNKWGKRKGDSDHKNVSDALEKAKEKLEA